MVIFNSYVSLPEGIIIFSIEMQFWWYAHFQTDPQKTSLAETVGALFHHTRRGSSTSQSPPDSPRAGPSRVRPQEKPRSAWKGR